MPEEPQTPPARGRYGRRRTLIAIVVALIVFAAVGAVVWFLRSSDSSSPTSATPPAGSATTTAAGGTVVRGISAETVSIEKLRALADDAGHPVFWAGPRADARIEFTQTTDGRTYVRYLTGSAKAGSNRPDYVVVATYPQPDAYNRVTAIARQRGYKIWKLPNGATAIAKFNQAKNMYVVYPGKAYQVEVYAPSPADTRRLVFTSAIVPVV